MKSSEASGIKILLIGVTLLLVTFVIACINLGGINVLPVPSLTETFGATFSPIIEAAIQTLYLGVIGWIASKLTTKGLTEILQSRHN